MTLDQSQRASPVLRAAALATLAHHGQTDKAGQPYIEHPRRVAEYVDDALEVFGEVWGAPQTEEVRDLLRSIAWLHDAIEDTWVTTGVLSQTGFDRTVIEGVTRLTRGFFPFTDASEGYYAVVKAHWASRIVKVADLLDNTDPDRLVLLPEQTQQRLIAKYATAAAALGCEDFLDAFNEERWIDTRQRLADGSQRHPDSPNCIVL